jgi:hypothetical protein
MRWLVAATASSSGEPGVDELTEGQGIGGDAQVTVDPRDVERRAEEPAAGREEVGRPDDAAGAAFFQRRDNAIAVCVVIGTPSAWQVRDTFIADVSASSQCARCAGTITALAEESSMQWTLPAPAGGDDAGR